LGESISVLGLVNTALAGLMLSAAWMATRRLWLCVAIHAAWNYTLGSIFSIAVSGHPAKGLINGALNGPDWVTGGIYGLEGSVAALVVMAGLFVILLQRARVKGAVLPSRWSAAGRAAALPAVH
jgi:membrane protease YdiL (CAAX protease family)